MAPQAYATGRGYPSIERVTGWIPGQLIFDDSPLREAVAEFNRYNAVQVAVALQETGQIPVGGVFRIGDSTSFARGGGVS